MGEFEIGRTITRAIGLIGKSLSTAGVFLLIGHGINSIGSYLFQSRLAVAMEAPARTGDPMAPLAIFKSGWYWGALIVGIFMSAVLFAGSIQAMLKTASGEHASLGDCFNACFSKLAAVLALEVIWYIGIVLGMVVLIVPGIILICMWSAAIPALIGEDIGPVAALGRSRQLTRGDRLKIFVILLILLLVIYGLSFGVSAAVTGMSVGKLTPRIAASPTHVLAMLPVGWITAYLMNAVLVSIYVEAVLEKEGGAGGQLKNVFD
jgi:hypothetical protein